jgi:fatty-acid peroxygenase
MSQIPRDPAIDSTLAMMREGYDFLWNRFRRFETDIFSARIMGKRAVCIHGPEAAELFYDESKLRRQGALPRRVETSLFGKGAVHSLDDAAHRRRKAAFLSLMAPANLELLMDETAKEWRRSIRRWEREPVVVLFDEAIRILTAATFRWAGVPLQGVELRRRAQDAEWMIDAFGGVGPRLWKGKVARMATEAWMITIIDDVRRGALRADAGSALHVMAHHRDADGQLLSPKVAAVEVLNVVRPTIAVAWYIAYAALALQQYPDTREKIAREPFGNEAGKYADQFMQEVRRFYPFTPYLGAKVRTPFEWRGHRFEPNTLVLLDVYGTHHDPAVWSAPDEFRPERFEHWSGSPYDFIPQGGGHRPTGHRCPGEWITMHNMTLALHFLTRCMTYDAAPSQDLRFDRTRMPTRPKSGFLIQNVRATTSLDGPVPRLPSATASRDNAEAVRAREVGVGAHV